VRHRLLFELCFVLLASLVWPGRPIAQSGGVAPAAFSWRGAETFAKGTLLHDRMDAEHYQVFGVERKGPGAVEFHALDTDIVMVLEGSATFVTGGSIADERERSANERTGSSITGGEARTLSRGDTIVVPNGVPHWFRDVNGSIRYCAVKVRQQAASPSWPAAVRFWPAGEAFAKGGLLFEAKDGRPFQIFTLSRTQPLGVELHQRDTDVVFVLDGKGTFITGGTITEPRTLRENEGTGSGISDGRAIPLDKGSVAVLPAGLPHWLKEIDETLAFFAVKVR
jgi:quercetin dioxygenase-like cupin family protein